MRNYTSPEYQLAVTLVIFQQGGADTLRSPLAQSFTTLGATHLQCRKVV